MPADADQEPKAKTGGALGAAARMARCQQPPAEAEAEAEGEGVCRQAAGQEADAAVDKKKVRC